MRVKHRVGKEELKEDKFQQTVEKVAEFYYADPRRFWIGVAVGLLVIIGVILLIQNRPKPGVNAEAELRLMDALGNYFQGNNEYAEQALKELAAKFGRDYAGIKAHYYLGSLYLRQQPPRLDEARREFRTFLKKSGRDPVLTPAALMGLAVCEEKQGNYLKAAGLYEKVYRGFAQSPLGFEGMMQAGRCYRQAGALDKAEKVYNDLLKKEKTGPKVEEIRSELAFIQALKNRL
ncbi:tetratricopeptide repeat protein [candidate division WOR-3 bacterium]|nr:tetratricopeptide repeat protein [candidate division WOR-3 bacterium]